MGDKRQKPKEQWWVACRRLRNVERLAEDEVGMCMSTHTRNWCSRFGV